MNYFPLAFGSFNIDNVSGISFAITAHMNRLKVAITPTKLIFSYAFVVRLTGSHLGIICWLLFVKNTDIFMLP
ncbi:hypothetical protein SDC9_205556 [bioreactor metagenome]|uniref:Uncharacterized protein n=1 Tax=bioreactor metagenome TaxID=1076179 RepID=A0A645J408_9ZZZZ